MPTTSAQASVATVGSTSGGTTVSASEKVPKPVQASSPTKISDPIPDASRPGRATRLSVTPLTPAASMIRNAPSSGEPSSVLIAAKLPADAMMVTAIGGASFFTDRTARAPRPPPIAINGASGPRTAPRLSVVSAARMTLISSGPLGGPPPVLKPKAGEWPAFPGRYWIVSAVSRPQSTSQGIGHQAGGGPPVSCVGQVGEQVPLDLADQRQEAVGGGRDRDAEDGGEDQSATRYGRDRITAIGSTPGGPPGVAVGSGSGGGGAGRSRWVVRVGHQMCLS